MIQATNNVNPKALVNAKGNALVDGVAIDPEAMVEGGDFAAELMANLQVEDPELKVSPVQISPDQLINSPLQNIPEVQPDKINPKVFDPALTNGVDSLVQPKTTLVEGEMVSPELTQAMLKTPQLQAGVVEGGNPAGLNPAGLNPTGLNPAGLNPTGLNPTGLNPTTEANPELAVELKALQGEKISKEAVAETGVDSQLMSGDEFVSQKNLTMKKNFNPAAYGMKNPKSGAEASELSSLIKPKTTGTELAAGEATTSSGAGSSVNSQYFILGNLAEQNGASVSGKEVAAPTKTFDLSQIKTSNPDQILSQVTDYMVQAKAAKEPTVNLRMKHEDLGTIDITVQRANQEAISINIGAHSVDGKAFFQQNSKDLVSHLTNAGLTVADMKVETSSQTAKNSGFDMNNSDSGRQGYGSEKNFGSEQNQRRHDSERRQELWNSLYNKEAA
jgi:hypothetical protein